MVRKYPEFVYDSEPTQAQVNDAATREYGIFVPAGETVKARRDNRCKQAIIAEIEQRRARIARRLER